MTCPRCATSYDGQECPRCGLPAHVELLSSEGPAAAPPRGPRTRAGGGRAALLGLAAVVPLLAVGTFFAVASDGQSGAETPAEAVSALLAAAEAADPLALLEVVDPRESTPLLPAVRAALERAEDVGALQDGRLPGVGLDVEGLQLEETGRSAGTAVVALTAGTLSQAGESQDVAELAAEAREAGVDGVFAVTVEREGRWYVSLTRTGLEYARQATDGPDVGGASPSPTASATPGDALRATLLAGSPADLVRTLPAQQYDGLYAYLPWIDDVADDAGVYGLLFGFGLSEQVEVDRLETSETDLGDGLVRVRVDRFDGSFGAFGSTTAVAFDGTCADTTYTFEEVFLGPDGGELFTADGEPFAGEGSAFDAQGRDLGPYDAPYFGIVDEQGAPYSGTGTGYTLDGDVVIESASEDPLAGYVTEDGEPWAGLGAGYDEDGELLFEDGEGPYFGLFAEDGSPYLGTGPAYDEDGLLLGDLASPYFSYFGPDGAVYTGEGPVFDASGRLLADSFDAPYFGLYAEDGSPYAGEGPAFYEDGSQAYDSAEQATEDGGYGSDFSIVYDGSYGPSGAETSRDCLEGALSERLGGGVSAVVREVEGGYALDPLATVGDYAETFLAALSDDDVRCLAERVTAGLRDDEADEAACEGSDL